MPVDPKLWKEVWDACPWATIFASPLWHAVTEEIEPQDASFEWKGIITPLRKIKLAKGLLSGYESSVPGVPAGPIALELPEAATIQAYWQELVRRTVGKFLIHLPPDSPFINTPFRKIEIYTHILNISEKDRKMSKHHRDRMKKAQKAGVYVTPGLRDEDFEAYMDMYNASLQRWKTKPARIYPQSFFQRVREILVPADSAGFFMAWKDMKPQVGSLVLYGHKRAVSWHTVRADDSVRGANQLLNWMIMEQAAKRGITEFDFGPSPKMEGVAKFKERFGAELESQITIVGPARLFSFYFLRRARQ